MVLSSFLFSDPKLKDAKRRETDRFKLSLSKKLLKGLSFDLIAKVVGNIYKNLNNFDIFFWGDKRLIIFYLTDKNFARNLVKVNIIL